MDEKMHMVIHDTKINNVKMVLPLCFYDERKEKISGDTAIETELATVYTRGDMIPGTVNENTRFAHTFVTRISW